LIRLKHSYHRILSLFSLYTYKFIGHYSPFLTGSVSISQALHVSTLENLHRDPFDRLLVAQAQLERIPILTADQYIAAYPVETIW
jgi:PIN domain nuclease of toxin-antitoxin system